MERGKKIEFETHLPKDMIQHIQSILSRKEAARTTILSKSWCGAWLTRPSLVFDQRDFKNLDPRPSTVEFSKFVWKTMQRYGDSNLKIESFALQTQSLKIEILAQKWIVDAIKMGATDLNLEFEGCTFVLPPKVLESEALLRLSVSGCEIDGNVINCSLLKSLSLDSARLKRDDEMIKDIFSCCKSIEELSLSNCSDYKCRKLALSGMNLCELHKLRRVCLEKVEVDDSFFDDFEFRFPCLKDLSLVRCHGCSRIRIGSTSLQRISIVQVEVLSADFNVPNLANFSYSGEDIPSSLSILAREWESHISIKCYHSPTTSWYLSLKKLLTELSPSRISLSLDILVFLCGGV